jgi:crossover junction endodeoxyribonuclease RuvC
LRILGVDPGLRVTGYGVIEAPKGAVRGTHVELVEAGVIRTGAETGIAARLRTVYEALDEIILEFKPDVLVIEKLYAHYKHPATAILMGHARGVVCLLSGTRNVRLVNLASTHVKKAVSGSGHAGKEQIARMVAHYLGLKPSSAPPDATDALAIGIAYAFNARETQ